MYYPATYPRRQPGLPNVSQQVRQWLRTLLPPPMQPVQLQPGDTYVLDAGHYHLRVQAGSVWVPEVSAAMIKYAKSRNEKSSKSRMKSTFCIMVAGGIKYDSQGGIYEDFDVT